MKSLIRYLLALACLIEATYIPANVLVGVQAPYLYGRFSVITSFFYIIVGFLLIIQSIDIIVIRIHHQKSFFIINSLLAFCLLLSIGWSIHYNDHATCMLVIAFIINLFIFIYSYPQKQKK